MTSARLVTRFAKPEDHSVLAELLLTANRHYWGEWDGAEAMTAAAAEAMVTGRSGCTAFIAWLDGEPCAFATVAILHPALNEHGTLFMKDLFVAEGARGTGIGTQIMQHLAKQAVELGCERFDWTAETDNPQALAFYDQMGAERIDEKIYFRFSGETLTGFAASGAKGDDR
ncbi:MAG: GNAT family N-acetyltransferase [Pseudomonadota bacterium]